MSNAIEAARTSTSSLPVVDISGLSEKLAVERAAVGAQLRAARRWRVRAEIVRTENNRELTSALLATERPLQ